MSPCQRNRSSFGMLIKSSNKFQFMRPLERLASSLPQTGICSSPSPVNIIKQQPNSLLELIQHLTPMFPTLGKLSKTI